MLGLLTEEGEARVEGVGGADRLELRAGLAGGS